MSFLSSILEQVNGLAQDVLDSARVLRGDPGPTILKLHTPLPY